MSSGRDSYATMLLTMTLSPDREEYAHPLPAREFHALEASLREAGVSGLGALIDMDIFQLMDALHVPEEQALRLYTLMNRAVTMNYGLENMMMQGISALTKFDPAYPDRITQRLGELAPPMLYAAGSLTLTALPAIAVIGIRGVKTTPQLREGIERLCGQATERGYAVLTGGEPGVSRVATDATDRTGGVLINVLAGSMRDSLKDAPVERMIREGRCAVLSAEHPDALFTTMHALSRNRVLFAMARAAFICSTDGRRGEAEALQRGTCDHIYAWSGAGNAAQLIQRGAVPISDLRHFDFASNAKKWEQSEAEQINMFELL